MPVLKRSRALRNWAAFVGIGTGFYLLSAVWSAVFIVTIPLAPDWCLDGFYSDPQERTVEFTCFDYKDRYEEVKHFHAEQMVDRNRVWVFAMLMVSGLFGMRLFDLRNGRDLDAHASRVLGFFLGMTASFVVPFVLSLALPPPAEWMPDVLLEVNQRIERSLETELRSRSMR